MLSNLFRVIAVLPLLLLYGSMPREELPFVGVKRVVLVARPVDLRGIAHAKRLQPLAGWALSSPDRDFGGLSGLTMGPNTLMSVGDVGMRFWLSADLATADIESLPKKCAPASTKRARDSESIFRDPKTGTNWIGFEWSNRVCRIKADGEAADYAPAAMQNWPSTGGAEAMTRLADGRFLVFAERPPDGSAISPLLVFDRDPVDQGAKVVKMRYSPPAGFRATDAAMLPDGRMLVVNRSYSFPLRFSAIVTLVEPFAVRKNALITGRPVAVLAPPGLADNFEGIAVSNEGDDVFIWLVSDDNFLPQQTTYLLKFAYRPL